MSTSYTIAFTALIFIVLVTGWCVYEMSKAEPENRDIYDADDEYECQHPTIPEHHRRTDIF